MKKVLVAVLAIALAMGLFVGCSDGGAAETGQAAGEPSAAQTAAAADPASAETPAAPSKEGETVEMAFIFNSLTNPVFVNWKNIMEEICPQYNIDIVATYSSDEDPAKELDNMMDAISKGVDVIGMSPSDSEASKEALKLAADAGIPVFTLDRSLEGTHAFAQYLTDNYEAAKLAGNEVVNLLGETGGKVAIVRGVLGLSIENDRYNGFMEIVSPHDNIEVVSEVVGNFSRDQANQVVNDIFSVAPDVDVIYCENGEMTIGVCMAAEAAGYADGEIKIIGYDGMPEELELIKAGKQYCTVFQVFDAMVPAMIEDVRAYMDGEDVPILCEYSGALVTKDNLDKYWYVVE